MRFRLLVERDVFVARRAESIEDAGVFECFHAMRNVARQIMRVTRTEHARIVADVHFHPAADNMDDLFLGMLVRRHHAAGFKLRDHLIHRLAVGDSATANAGREFNPGIFVHSLFLIRPLDSFNRRLSRVQHRCPDRDLRHLDAQII